MALPALLSLLSLSCYTLKTPPGSPYDVLVIGGGIGGIGAGLQSARLGARTVICEPTPWLGGMLSTAGVSAIDGNHLLPSGLWEEFRQAIYAHYGGPKAVLTGWVSDIHFEPSVADSILKVMARRESKLTVRFNTGFRRALKEGNRVIGAVFVDEKGQEFTVRAAVTIDATETGDVFANAGAAYSAGVDARADCQEKYSPEKASDVVQDLTWAAILKDYGPGKGPLVPAQPGYRPDAFRCCCKKYCPEAKHPCDKMLDYARLPNGKIMINWPLEGNDYYANVLEMSAAEREKVYALAKAHTLNFIHYMQTELGYTNLGLADDEYPTPDRLPFIAYHRESRRLRGVVRYNVNHILQPYEHPEPLYRTGVAVGDYPLDHHHLENPVPVDETYPDIPSFSLPLGALIPVEMDGLLAADKGTSVTHLVNGCTRLQPCVLLTGQAAGALAALAAQQRTAPRRVSIRAVQEKLLAAKAFLMPYLDVKPTDPAWDAIQRCGAAGILKGKGIPNGWASETWFYPDSTLVNLDFLAGLQQWQPGFYDNVRLRAQTLTISDACVMLEALLKKEKTIASAAGRQISRESGAAERYFAGQWTALRLKNFNAERPVTRRELAVITEHLLAVFNRPVNWQGVFVIEN